MNRNLQKGLVIAAHAFVGWALCFATIGIGFAVTTQQTALIVHAVGAPIYFFGLSLLYFKRFAFTTPLQTALAFTCFVVVVDFLLVGLVILRSLDMFSSPLGTWIPFALIFTSTLLTGLVVTRQTAHRSPERLSGAPALLR